MVLNTWNPNNMAWSTSIPRVWHSYRICIFWSPWYLILITLVYSAISWTQFEWESSDQMPNKTIAIWSFLWLLVLVLILQDFLCNLFATLIKVNSVKRMTITLVKDSNYRNIDRIDLLRGLKSISENCMTKKIIWLQLRVCMSIYSNCTHR